MKYTHSFKSNSFNTILGTLMQCQWLIELCHEKVLHGNSRSGTIWYNFAVGQPIPSGQMPPCFYRNHAPSANVLVINPSTRRYLTCGIGFPRISDLPSPSKLKEHFVPTSLFQKCLRVWVLNKYIIIDSSVQIE